MALYKHHYNVNQDRGSGYYPEFFMNIFMNIHGHGLHQT